MAHPGAMIMSAGSESTIVSIDAGSSRALPSGMDQWTL